VNDTWRGGDNNNTALELTGNNLYDKGDTTARSLQTDDNGMTDRPLIRGNGGHAEGEGSTRRIFGQ